MELARLQISRFCLRKMGSTDYYRYQNLKSKIPYGDRDVKGWTHQL